MFQIIKLLFIIQLTVFVFGQEVRAQTNIKSQMDTMLKTWYCADVDSIYEVSQCYTFKEKEIQKDLEMIRKINIMILTFENNIDFNSILNNYLGLDTTLDVVDSLGYFYLSGGYLYSECRVDSEAIVIHVLPTETHYGKNNKFVVGCNSIFPMEYNYLFNPYYFLKYLDGQSTLLERGAEYTNESFKYVVWRNSSAGE